MENTAHSTTGTNPAEERKTVSAKRMMSQLDRIYDEESARLETQWRRTHFHTMLAMSAVTILTELLFSFILRAGGIVHASVPEYYLRYVIIPGMIYLLLDLAAYFICRLPRLTGRLRNYAVSFFFATMCLTVCIFHDYFVVLYASGVAAISLTTIYGDRKLTGLVTLYLIVMSVLTAFVNKWDVMVVRDAQYYINVALVVLIDLCTYLASSMIVQWEDKRRHAVVLRQIEIEHLREAAARDQLTGVRNRLGLRRNIAEHTSPMRYVMIDIDHFKSVNDRWGHAEGDKVLQSLGSLLLERESENVAAFRYGGDEFLLTFSDADSGQIRKVCGELAEAFLGALPPEIRESGVAISCGVSPAGGNLKPSEAIRLADEDLYAAKQRP